MTVKAIGGLFFKSQDPKELSAWYEEHLGLADLGDGVIFGWRKYDRPDEIGQTVWSPFKAETTYFEPSQASWMVNFRVDNLDATLERLESEGIESVGEVERSEYGNFGWILDPENNKIELWEPPGAEWSDVSVPAPNPPGLDGEWICPPGTTIAAAGDLSARQIDKERLVELPVAEVWRLWTTGDGMAQWWVEDNQIELRIGGPMELYFMSDASDGERGSDNCRVLSFLPEKMLSFTWNAPPNHEYTRPRHTHVVLEFEAVSDTSTNVSLHHLGWPEKDFEDNEEWAETFAYFNDAWEQVLDLLVDHGAE